MDIKMLISFGAGITALVITAIIVYVIKPKSKSQQILATAKQNNWVAQGHEVKSVFRHGDSQESNSYLREASYRVTYEYTIDGRTYKKKLTFGSGGNLSVGAPGTINIYYLKDNPRKGVTQEEVNAGKGRLGCFLCMALPIAVFGITVQVVERIIK